MVCTIIAAFLGASAVAVATTALVILGLQWFTKFPFRWGWRAHSEPIGVQVPDGDPRLETKRVPRVAFSRRTIAEPEPH
jgi:hypothetical protein